MGQDNLCMVFAPSYLHCPYSDPNKIFSAAEKEKEFVLSLWNIVPTIPQQFTSNVPHTLLFEREEQYIAYYSEYFSQEEHINFIGKDANEHPMIISVANSFGRDQFRTLVITVQETYRILIPATKEKEILSVVKSSLPNVTFHKVNQVKNHKKFIKEVLNFEKLQIANNYKWGVCDIIATSI